MCCFVDKDNVDKSTTCEKFIGLGCGESMLKSLCDTYGVKKLDKANGGGRVIMYAHNSGFDFLFLLKYLKASKIIRQGTSLLLYKGRYAHKGKIIEITIRDTYKLISKPLRDFGKCFNLKQSKEVMPYSLQTEDLIKKRYLSRAEVMGASELVLHAPVLNKTKLGSQEKEEREFYKAFWSNADRWRCYDADSDQFDLIKYAGKYCAMDCLVLKSGYEIFNNWMIEATGLSIFSHLTIPSLVHEYFIQQGCYKDVLECSGVVRAFIQKCVVGGRTMLRNNEKCRIVGGEEYSRFHDGEGKMGSIQTGGLADYDAVSLYPSAMFRMKGFLKGRPQVLSSNQLNYKFLQHQDGYFIKINILKIGTMRPFPLMSEMRDGVRCFVNENLQGVYVDKVGLEDMINFQGVEFETIQGYYFSDARNDTIKKVIRELFQERIIKKKAKNPIQEIYKLLMNSSYGKAIMRPVEHKDKIVSSTLKKDNFVSTNFASIEHFRKHEFR
jgi:hypothetical protein